MKQDWKAVGRHGTVGIEVVLSILVGYFGGAWLDGKLGTNPWLGFIGLAYGIAAAVRALYRAARRATQEAEELDRREREERERFRNEHDGT